MARSKASGALFGWVVVTVVILDFITKAIALSALGKVFEPVRVVGNAVRLTLVFNKGAAFGITAGEYSRWVFLIATIGALVVLWRMFRNTQKGDTMRLLALSLVVGGAFGNLIDRIRWSRGVVDFIDVGIGDRLRWPTFNVADMAVSVGAVLLALVLWREDAAGGSERAEQPPPRGLVEDRREAL